MFVLVLVLVLDVGETIPIRLFLGGFELTPTFREVNKKFSTRYYLNLVLIDEENRRYFKQQVRCSLVLMLESLLSGVLQEITIYRIPEVGSAVSPFDSYDADAPRPQN